MKKLTDICDIQYGYAFDSKCFTEDSSYPQLVRIRDVKKGYSETYYSGDYPEEYILSEDDLLVGMDGEFNIARWKCSGALLNQRVCRLTAKVGTNEEYLRFAMSKSLKEIEQRTAFVTVKHLSAKELNKLELDVPELSKQDKIADTLSRLERVIESRQEELEKLDDLIKARFVELFGFPGTDEKGWGLRPLGECCEINPKKVSDKRLASGMQVSFVPMTAVSENGAIKTAEKKTYDEVKVGFTYFAENDVLFAKITPCMENGKGAVAVGLCNGIGFGSTEFHVLRPLNGRSNPYWLYSLISFDTFRKDAAANMTGSAGQRRVPSMFLKKYKITLPPFELQNQFADFVHEVDKSKVAVQKALTETQLLFDSLMQQYFG